MLQLLLGFMLSLTQPAGPAVTPQTVRIVILDLSGSMAGPRIGTALQELQSLARQLPPSPQHPIIMVPFRDKVDEREVITYRDARLFSQALLRLKADGGTSIASGLERAVRELNPYRQLPHVMVLLYTDGEDNDQEGINRAEEKLNQLFGQRSKQGLGQTFVFCKRWENANKALLQRLTERGNVTIADAGELQLLPVMLTPQVRLISATWKTNPLAFEIEAELLVAAPGLPSLSLPKVQGQCITTGLQGDLRFEITPHPQQGKRLRFQLPMKIPSAGNVLLQFTLASPIPQASGRFFMLPQLAKHQLELSVPVPPLKITASWSAQLTATQKPVWRNPTTRQMAIPLQLTIQVTPDQPYPWPAPVALKIEPIAPFRIETMPNITFDSGGIKTIPLTFIADQVSTSNSKLPVCLKLYQQTPGLVQCSPSMLQTSYDVQPPGPVTTTISMRPLQVRSSRWVDLAHALAIVETDVEFRVEGPLEPNTILQLKAPPGVTHFEFQPNSVQTGTQVLKLTMETTLSAAPKPTSFTFSCEPPADQGAVRIAKPLPLSIHVPGLAPLQLVLQQDRVFPRQLEFRLSDEAAEGNLTVIPMIWGLQKPEYAQGLQAQSQLTPSHLQSKSSLLTLFQTGTLTVTRPPDTLHSFFVDAIVEGELTVEPYPPTSAVIGSRYPLIVRLEAPFRRLLFWLGLSVGGLGMLLLLIRLFIRMRSVEKLHDPSEANAV